MMIELRIGPLIVTVWLLLINFVAGETIQPRWSCYNHFVAGNSESGVYPIAGPNSNMVSNLKCRMREKSADTEIHSALEVAYQVMNKKSVNYQMSDLFHLRELVRRSVCQQKVYVNWTNIPEHGRGGITFISLLNTSHRVEYNGEDNQQLLITGRFAGVRHLIPDENDYDSNPLISASSLRCEHFPQPDCQFHGRIEIDLEANLEWNYSFSFKTDTTNQTLFSLQSGSFLSNVRIENDYFVRVDSSQPIPIRHLSDSKWHTIVVKHSDPDRHFFIIDDSQEIELPKGLNTEDTTTTLIVSVIGDIQLIDPTDTNDDCLVSLAQHRRRLQESVITRSLCSGCGCSILTDSFDNLSRCLEDDDGDAISFRRDTDRLAFLFSNDAFDFDTNGAVTPQISVTFRSDSDSGLVFFGYWHTSRSKGRLQVYYHYDTISAVYCQHRDEEQCVACSIKRKRLGEEKWIQTILWGGGDEIHFAVDTSICQLETNSNTSVSEVYAIPQLTPYESGLFIGGTWHEKKRHGLYRNEVEHMFFENTREKSPVLRGCVKNIFTKGLKMDLPSTLEKQRDMFLLDPEESDAFAVNKGCRQCIPTCLLDTRCRSYRPIESSPNICDCSDVLQFNNSYGYCEKTSTTPIVLSTSFLSQPEMVVEIDNTKAVLSKVWIQFSLPKQIEKDHTIVEFNSHREKLFNIRIDIDGYVHIQGHGQDDDRNAARQLSLADDRVHMIKLERRTPIGTRHNAKKFDLYIDSWHAIISDIGKMVLNNITVFATESQDEYSSVILHAFGLGYDYDEHFAILSPSNAIKQIDVHSELLKYQFRVPDLSKTGILDPYLWEKTSESTMESSPYGQIVDFTADVIEPEQLLSARWIMYSLFLTILLCLLILICIVCYWCVIRRKSLRRDDSGSQRTIMRDSPDYGPVKLRRSSHGDISLDEDGSIGTDDTDLQAYRDIPSHRVKIYRESMVSILVPSIDLPAEAAIVKRPTSSVSDQYVASPTQPSDSHAPLVRVNDD